MRLIKLTENQMEKLFLYEYSSTIGSDTPNTVQEFPGSTVSATANIDDTNGDVTYGKPKTTDKVQHDLTNQSFMDGHRKW